MKVHLTQEQLIFYIGQKKLKKLQASENPNMDEINEIRELLWKAIVRFAQKEVNRMMGAYSTQDERDDVMQDLVLVFLEKLPYYNPVKSAPTTYFIRYFREKITKYIRSSKVHLTQYDANNMRKINAAANGFKKNGIPYTLDMLSAKTGLSERVIQSTLFYASNAKTASVEEAYSIQSDAPSPELAYQQNEAERVLYQALTENLTAEERRLLLTRINAEGNKGKPYDVIAKETGMSIMQVKSTINRALCKLHQDVRLRQEFGNYNEYRDALTKIPIQDDAVDIMEDQLSCFLEQMH